MAEDPKAECITNVLRMIVEESCSEQFSSSLENLLVTGAGGEYTLIMEGEGFSYHNLLDMRTRSSHSGDLFVATDHREEGIGDLLVAIHEELCMQIGISSILVNDNVNPTFWYRKGYMPVADTTAYERLGLDLNDPLIKYLDDLQ